MEISTENWLESEIFLNLKSRRNSLKSHVLEYGTLGISCRRQKEQKRIKWRRWRGERRSGEEISQNKDAKAQDSQKWLGDILQSALLQHQSSPRSPPKDQQKLLYAKVDVFVLSCCKSCFLSSVSPFPMQTLVTLPGGRTCGVWWPNAESSMNANPHHSSV